MVYEILCTTTFGREKKGEVGVSRLVDEGAFNASFPVHDVRLSMEKSVFEKVFSSPGNSCVSWAKSEP